MNGLFALTACGPMCWEAREDVCRCSCGGANHGIHRHTRPDCAGLKRQMVYEGFIWELSRVSAVEDRGSNRFSPEHLDSEAQELNTKAGIRYLYAHTARQHYGEFPVAIVRPATASQIAKWPELNAWRFEDAEHSMAMYGKPQLLWLRRDDITQQVHEAMRKAA